MSIIELSPTRLGPLQAVTAGRSAPSALVRPRLGRSGQIDSLRAIAIVWVLFDHFWLQRTPVTLVESVRGPGGGYTLARDLAKVSVADIITAVDEPLDATQCGGKENCKDGEQRCMTHATRRLQAEPVRL